MKLEKIAYPDFLFYFFLSSMYEAIGETILPNNFVKIAQLYLRKLLIKFFHKKTILKLY